MAAKEDPELATTGVTYVEWSRSSQAHKEELRKKLDVVARAIVERHQLVALLKSLPADAALVAEQRAKNEKRLAGTLAIADPATADLVRYCPGAEGNVSVNPEHPAFAKFKVLIDQPAGAETYRAAIRSFGVYLDAHPTASVDQRNEELRKILVPVFSELQ